MKLVSVVAACCALTLAVGAQAAENKSEDLIKARQAAYAYMAWNMSRIKANTEPAATYNQEDVVKAANAIQAVANSGLGALYAKGTEKGKGFHPTRVRPEAFMAQHGPKLGKIAGDFNREANAMAAVAAGGDKDAVKAQFEKLGGTCKACHDDFRKK
ncbi:MAG: c-type cytochrome [Gammaproteobacteria bacterium]